MVIILIMSAKLATLGFLKKRNFKIKVMTSELLTMTSPTKFYRVTQIIL